MNVNHFELRSDNAIVIKNIELFSSEILPKYFKHTSFKSFEKQVRLLLSFLRLSLRVYCSYTSMTSIACPRWTRTRRWSLDTSASRGVVPTS